jgi:hypothetical protein
MTTTFENTTLYTSWHLNLAFSSIEVEERGEVIEKCYWPLLEMIERTGIPQGVEASAYTLEVLNDLDPLWVKKAKQLASSGQLEFISSGYFQIVGPLVPANVTFENVRLGRETCDQILGDSSGEIFFVNEQCTSEGLLNLLQELGFRAAIVEWENWWLADRQLDESIGWKPQRFRSIDGIGIIWNHSRLFQGLQRFAHGELDNSSLLHLYSRESAETARALCAYGGDAEVFGYRPGRFASEASIGACEWEKVEAFLLDSVSGGASWVLPSDLLSQLPEDGINCFSLEHQILTKKQPKYNALRWATSGRANLEINNFCHANEGSMRMNASRDDLNLWSSDYRTHLTEKRWTHLLGSSPKLASHLARDHCEVWVNTEDNSLLKGGDELIILDNQLMAVELDPFRGLSLESLRLSGSELKLIGRIPFGYFSGPEHSPDWFSCNFVYQQPGHRQVTDLDSNSSRTFKHTDERKAISRLENDYFEFQKSLQLHESLPTLTVDYLFRWKIPPMGALRIGFLSIRPDAWHRESLTFSSHNGGRGPQSYPLPAASFSHGAPVNPGISATNCVGMTGGLFSISDGQKSIDVTVSQFSRGAVLMLDYENRVKSWNLRTSFSLFEYDDTSRIHATEYTRFSFSISASDSSSTKTA